MTPVKSTGIHFNVGGTQQSRTSQNCCVCVKPVYNWGIVMRATYVSLSFVLCAVIIVGSCPLHQLKVDPSADEDYLLISSFQSPQKESVMGGYLSRSRRREDKKEKNSPRLEPIEAEPDQNEIEVDEKRYVENVPNVDGITVREEVEACQTSSCADSLEPDETPVEVISTAFDVIDPAPRSPLYPSPEEMLMDVNAEEQQETDRQMRPCHSDVLSDTETKMENPGGISEVSHPLFKTNPSEAEVKEGEVGKAEKERHGRSSPMFSDSVVNDSEADVTVDVQNLDPVFDSSLNREEEQTFLRNLDEEDVIEINVDEPQNDRIGSSPYRSGVILGPVLVDDEPEIIVDVLSEGSRPVFDPSIHLMAEPVIFHPQPVPMDDIIELELAIDDELVKRKKRTLQKSNNVHPESKESQPGLDDEDLIDVNVGMYRQKKRARKIPRHKTLLDSPI